MKKILFVGLGRMGSHMAGHIAKTGEFVVKVYNRSQSKIDQWMSKYAGGALLPEDQFDAIILCIGNDEDVLSSITGSLDLISKVKPNGVIVDHTTTSANLSETIYAIVKEKNIGYLDAPVSGGEAGAIKGQLSCMVGGDAEYLDAVMPILNTYCKNITHIGKSGSGQIAKMANQLCIAGTLAGLSEAINLLKKSDINTELVFQAIKNGAAQSWQMDNRFKTMSQGKFDFGFAINHMIKDLKYALKQADKQQFDPIISRQIIRWYEDLSKKGFGEYDTSCLVEYYKNSM